MFAKSIPVFCYHDVGPGGGHSVERFREHLDAIESAGYSTVTAAEVVRFMRGETRLDGRRVLLTFDDGHFSSRTVIAPELARRGMTGCFFVLPGFTDDRPARGESGFPEPLPMPKSLINAHGNGDHSQFMNSGEIREMLNMGMEIHSHGMRHNGVFRDLAFRETMSCPVAHWGAWSLYPGYDPDWPVFKVGSAYVYDGFQPFVGQDNVPRFRLRSEADRLAFCRKDFRESLERLRELSGQAEQYFCWPWGEFDAAAEAELRKAGYSAAFTLERGPNSRGGDPFRINRVGVGRKKTGAWLEQRLKMYSGKVRASVFFKRFTKRDAPHCVLLASDSTKLSGGSRQMINNAQALNGLGIRTIAMLRPDSPLVAEMREAGAEVVEYEGFRKPFKAASMLKRLVREKHVDVVHTFHNRAYKMGAIARITGGKFRFFVNRGVISRPNDVFFLWTAPADAVICNSMECAEVLRRRHVPKSRLAVVYNAYCGLDLGGPSTRKKRGVRVLYIGNTAHIKGFDVFLKAMEAFCEDDARDVEFAAVGIEDRDLPRFAEAVDSGAMARFNNCGVLSHAETLEQIRVSDMLVVPSRKESLPNTLLEAFDAGLPAVVTRVGGMPEVVRDGVNGFVCESEDAKCIAERIRRLRDDWDLRQRMGGVNRAVVRTLMTREAKGRNLVNVYMGQNTLRLLPVEEVAHGE
ncbi:glycosyltransferase [Salidesulfovibrio brasiliensis]|uniref:glycosyltransferase n=1 Tax=Salidesulfovibrio brasiliensis TaxID=221711 RepID=UPI0006D25E8A|nr:glycosyltransferase [Salidesulfovibrio brasiliensis]